MAPEPKPPHLEDSAMKLSLSLAAGTLAAAAALPLPAQSPDDGRDVPVSAAVRDAPIASWRTDLLELALSAASKYPLDPHVKNRSRAQEHVAITAFELDQPLLALRAVDAIANWRRGTGYADFARYCVEAGDLELVDEFLAKAEQVAETSPDALAQDWRADRIRVKIAQALVLLGDSERAAEYEVDLVDSEVGKVALARARRAERENLEANLAELQAVLDTESFDMIVNAMPVYVELYGRFFDDEDVRDRIRTSVVEGWAPLPSDIRIDTLEALADHALDHGDGEEADALIAMAIDEFEKMHVNPEFGVPIRAQLAGLRHRAGHTAAARELLAEALEVYDADRELISKTFRPDTLIPVAEAYARLGDEQAALTVYEKALVAALVSPNSRPRTDDLVAICCSLARHDCRPTDSLTARLRGVHDALGQPW